MNQESIVEEVRKDGWLTAGAWALLLAGLAVGFGPNFAEMWHRWFPAWRHSGISLYEGITRGESYYTHAPLVPAVSIIIILLLIRYTTIPVRPRLKMGMLVLVLGSLFHLAACLARVNFASGFAFIVVLIGIVLSLWGKEALKRFWFPLVFLFFMVPLPEVSIAQLNFRLKMIAADWGVQLANLLVIAERSGNQVFLTGEKSMVVANICNGLRTLISVIAFGALYAYICRLRGIWRVVLFLMSVPVAVVSNSIRIVSLILVADLWDVETATGWYHDFSGLMILVMAFALLFGLEKAILWVRKKVGRPVEIVALFEGERRTSEEDKQFQRLLGAIMRPSGWTTVILISLTAVGSVYISQSKPSIYDKEMLKKALPVEIHHNGETWKGNDLPVDRQTALVLETEDIIHRRYFDPVSSITVDFCVIFSEDNRKGTHPPDLCLEGGGMNIMYKKDILVSGIPGHDAIPCREIIVQSGRDYTYFLYTYKCGDRYTSSFWRQQFIIFMKRDVGGALIRVSTPMPNGPKDAQARDRSKEFMRIGIPHMEKKLQEKLKEQENTLP